MGREEAAYEFLKYAEEKGGKGNYIVLVGSESEEYCVSLMFNRILLAGRYLPEGERTARNSSRRSSRPYYYAHERRYYMIRTDLATNGIYSYRGNYKAGFLYADGAEESVEYGRFKEICPVFFGKGDGVDYIIRQ